jgi:allantoate deiminase
MTLRKDALAAAAEVVLALQAAARQEGEGTVGTVGKMTVSPGGSNIVPEAATFTMDIRSSGESG